MKYETTRYKSYRGATSTVSSYIESLELIKSKTEKNYLEMDLENSELNDEIEELLEEIKKKCDELIQKIGEYSFE